MAAPSVANVYPGGLQVQASCIVHKLAQQVLSLECPARIVNVGQEVLGVVAVDSSGLSQMVVLVPGQAIDLPDPGPGGAWVVAWETASQVRLQQDLSLAAGIGVAVLAGVGAATIALAIYHAATRTRW